jgi:hypothetical protein
MIRESSAHADVAQLVEHFTRNEGVPGSNPGVGFSEVPAIRAVFVRLMFVSSVARVMEAIWKPEREAPPLLSQGVEALVELLTV